MVSLPCASAVYLSRNMILAALPYAFAVYLSHNTHSAAFQVLMHQALQDGRIDQVQPILLTELYGWSCWRFNIAVKVQQQQQEVFYTINVDPFGHR